MRTVAIAAASSTWYFNAAITFPESRASNRTWEWARFVALNASQTQLSAYGNELSMNTTRLSWIDRLAAKSACAESTKLSV